MAKRGRPKKTQSLGNIQTVKADLKTLETVRSKELEILYNDLARIKNLIDLSLEQLGAVNDCENISEVAFRAGRAYSSIDRANDKIESMLDGIYDSSDFEHWTELFDEEL